MIKLFEQWLNENRSDELSYFDNEWTVIKFPWEEELQGKLGEIKEIMISIEEDFNVDRYTSPSYNFDIKIHDYPDMEELAEEYDSTEYEMQEQWNRYLEEQITDFADSLDFFWIEDVYQSGRSGGWLTLEVKSSNSLETIRQNVIDHLKEYVNDVEEYEPITKEELVKMRGSIMGNKFGLGGTSKSSEVDKIKQEMVGTINLLDEELTTLEQIKAELEETEKLIESGLEGLVAGFKIWITDND